MSNNYSPRDFFRRAPNQLLCQYFAAKNLLMGIDFAKLHETKIEPLYDAWLGLPDETRNYIDTDFQAITYLATEGGSKAILDAARYQGEDLGSIFSSMDGSFHGHALWTFLERPHYISAAEAYNHADTIAKSFWSKYKNIPQQPANTAPATLKVFAQELGNYLYTHYARGKNCTVEHYKRDQLDYFFAFPEDYAQSTIEWENQELKRRAHRPVLEMIFVYDQAEGKLDIYVPKDKKMTTDLHKIFCTCILGIQKSGDNKKDGKLYDLNCLKYRNFQFRYEPTSGIEQVTIKRLKALIQGYKKFSITLEADTTNNSEAIYQLLDDLTYSFKLNQLVILSANITVNMKHPITGKSKKISFNLNYPNSCNLKHDAASKIIRQMLIDSGLEPREALTE